MDELAHKAIRALSRCRFLPGSYTKRFVRDMESKDPAEMLTAKQEAFLKRLTWLYRKQIWAIDPTVDMTWARSTEDIAK